MAIDIIGVTGTNGKNSVSLMAYHILNTSGVRTAHVTTALNPFYSSMPELMDEVEAQGFKTVLMEVSSADIEHDVISGIQFRGAVFTNLVMVPHYHYKNFDDYFKIKTKLFEEYVAILSQCKNKFAVVNVSDPWGIRLRERMAGRLNMITYSTTHSMADIFIDSHALDARASHVMVDLFGRPVEIAAHAMNKQNASSILAAASTTVALGVDIQNIVDGIESYNEQAFETLDESHLWAIGTEEKGNEKNSFTI